MHSQVSRKNCYLITHGYIYMLRTPWGADAPAGQFWAGIYSASYAIAR